jgi:hypothetical protein
MLFLHVNKNLWIMVAVMILVIATESIAQRDVKVSLVQIDSVDYCGDKFLIAGIDVGTLTNQDNVLLYEYVVEYESDKLAFERLLTVGTLSDGIDNGGSGKLDSTSVRVFGFNITRPIRGSGFIVALLFRVKGDCYTKPRIKVLDNPEVNPDAKIRYVQSEPLIGNIKVKAKSSLKAEFSKDTIVVSDTASQMFLPLLITKEVGSSVDTMFIQTIYPKREVLSDSLDISSFGSIVNKQKNIGVTNDTVIYTVLRTVSNKLDSINAILNVTFNKNSSGLGNHQIEYGVIGTNRCSCVQPSKSDKIEVIVQKVTSVEDEKFNNTLHVLRNGDFWELTSIERINEVKAVDMLGRTYEVLLDESGIARIRIPEQYEVVFLQVRTASDTKTLKLMKLN